MEKDRKLEFYAPGGIYHICRDEREELKNSSCNGALKCGNYCEECQLDLQALKKCECEKAAVYELLRTGLVGEPVQVLQDIARKITPIKSRVDGEWRKFTKSIICYDANSLYIYGSGDVMRCGKDTLVVNEKLFDEK